MTSSPARAVNRCPCMPGPPGSHPLDRVIEADTVGGCLCFHTSAGRSSIWILGGRPKTTRPTSAAVSTSTRTHGTCTNMTAIKRPLRWMRLVHPAPQILPGCGRQRLRPMAEMDYAECSRRADQGILGASLVAGLGSGAALTDPACSSLVVGTSAAVAIVLGEPGSEELAVYLENALARLMPAAVRVELGIVLEAPLGPAGQDVVDRLLRDAEIDIVPVSGAADRAAISGAGAWPGGSVG
jgi:hypothetical protein